MFPSECKYSEKFMLSWTTIVIFKCSFIELSFSISFIFKKFFRFSCKIREFSMYNFLPVKPLIKPPNVEISRKTMMTMVDELWSKSGISPPESPPQPSLQPLNKFPREPDKPQSGEALLPMFGELLGLTNSDSRDSLLSGLTGSLGILLSGGDQFHQYQMSRKKR